MRAGHRRGVALTLAIVAGAVLGCPAFHNRERDVDRTPTVDTGAGATVIMPGQSPPVYQGPYHPKTSGRTPYGAPTAGQGAAAGGPAGGAPAQGPDTEGRHATSGGSPARSPSITMLGGATVEEQRHQKVEEAPRWWKYVKLPFAVVAAPFVYVADKVRPEPEPGPPVPTLENAPPPPPPGPAPTDYETAKLRQLERELEQREGSASGPPQPELRPEGASAPSQPAVSAGSFAAELAALRNAPPATPRPDRQHAAGNPMAPPAPRAADPAATRASVDPGRDALAGASGHVDRDGDGATDQWIFRERGEIVRELLDDDFDGRPDRTLHYDLATHQVRAIEEDANHDGRVDTWTQLADGAVSRRRADDDGDGQVDTWSYYRDGQLARLERDSSGDGFRDRLSHYENGRLVREEQDEDGDGRADAITHYDADEQVLRLEEDTDRDGRIDVISHYERGRLTRRELLDASMLAPAPMLSELE